MVLCMGKVGNDRSGVRKRNLTGISGGVHMILNALLAKRRYPARSGVSHMSARPPSSQWYFRWILSGDFIANAAVPSWKHRPTALALEPLGSLGMGKVGTSVLERMCLVLRR